MKTIAKQLNIQTFPFIIKDSDGNQIYFENSDGWWSKQEWAGGEEIYREYSHGSWSKWEYAGGEMIYWENSDGVIVDNRPKTDVQKAIELLTKEGLIVNGQILKN